MYTFISDDAHGWLKVPVSDVIASGVDVSNYSYRDARYAYLEEDGDGPAFMRAIGMKWSDTRIKDVRHNGMSRIRSMWGYQDFAPHNKE